MDTKPKKDEDLSVEKIQASEMTKGELQRKLAYLECELLYQTRREAELKVEVDAAERSKKQLQQQLRQTLEVQGKLLEQQLFLMRKKAKVMGVKVPAWVPPRPPSSLQTQSSKKQAQFHKKQAHIQKKQAQALNME